MKKKIKKKKKENKTWKEPDFEIYSLLDDQVHISGVICDVAPPCPCTCDPAS